MTSSEGRSLGRYRLERLVGRGGMAEVWEARDQTLGRRVAVKIILPNLAGEARFHDRFLSEARSVAALEHENVLPIYDFGDASGEPYLVMPFLEHGTLAQRLGHGPPTPAQAIEWIRQLASALDAAHAAGVLHRDVKPANIMLGGGGRLLLADFGIAKSNQSGDLTATGIALGTPAYMAPELARGEAATGASDRYALGVVAYELLCGRPPFVGDNALALLHQHLTTPVPTVTAARRDLPDDLDPAFARILAKDPEQRPATCAALADEIARAFQLLPVPDSSTARSIGSEDATLSVGVGAGPITPSTRALRESRPPTADSIPTVALPARGASSGDAAPARPRTGAVAAAAMVVLIAMAAAGWWWWSSREPSNAEPPTDLAELEVAAPPDVVVPDAPPAPQEDAPPARQEEVAPTPRAASAPPSAPPPSSPPRSDTDAASAANTVTESTSSADASAEVGPSAIPPAEAFAIFSLVADAWRQGRFRPELFTEVEQRSASVRATTHNAAVELLERWIEGGQALVRGDRDRARAVVAEFLTLQSPPEWVTLLPARFLARHPGPPPEWQIALFWADPRNEARALVDAALAATPNDRNLMLARAVVEHLDGRHAEAARLAVALDGQLRGARPRQVLARFAGDQLLWSGDVAAAISWYKRLLVAPDRTEIAAVLRTLSQEGGPTMVARACTAGFAPACDTGRLHPGQRGRRAKAQP